MIVANQILQRVSESQTVFIPINIRRCPTLFFRALKTDSAFTYTGISLGSHNLSDSGTKLPHFLLAKVFICL